MIHSYTYPLNHPTLKLEEFRLAQQKALLAAQTAHFMEVAVMRKMDQCFGTGGN